MNSKEALKELTLMINREKHINSEWNKKIYDLEHIIKQDLERLEELEKEYNNLKKDYDEKDLECIDLQLENEELKKENQELKDKYKRRAETSKELNEALTQYQKAIEILKDKAVNVAKLLLSFKTDNKLDYYNDGLFSFRLTQQEYDLLREVLGE